MSFFKKLFGGGGSGAKKDQPIDSVDHHGFTIETKSMDADGQFRVCADISKEVDGEVRTHRLIRADIFPTKQGASDESIRKAKIMIKEQGDRLFDSLR